MEKNGVRRRKRQLYEPKNLHENKWGVKMRKRITPSKEF